MNNRKPNIIIIQSDSMDGRVMGCMGHSAAYTPNMDRLAANGVLFKNTYCNSPQCVPSRASMFSGKYPHTIEGWNNYKGISKYYPTFLTDFARNGYQVNVHGYADYLSGDHSLLARIVAWTRAAGIDLPQKKKPEAKINQQELKEVHQNDWDTIRQGKIILEELVKKEEPFLFYCNVDTPHPPFETSKKWYDLIDDDSIEIPVQDVKLHPVTDYMINTKNCKHNFSDDEILKIRKTYYAMIAETDDIIGEMISSIEELDLMDNTYIIYLSDHGEMNMEHGQFLKNSFYESSARVPLIITGPGIEQERTIDDLVSLVDIYPTLIDMAGISSREDLEGHSLLKEIKGDPVENPDWVLGQYYSNFAQTSGFMLRQGDWKYIDYIGYNPQLFNLTEDPEEIYNIADKKPEIVKDMNYKLNKIIDTKAVDKKSKLYDKKSFCQWRQELGEEKYLQAMKDIYSDWGHQEEEKIKQWLDSY